MGFRFSTTWASVDCQVQPFRAVIKSVYGFILRRRGDEEAPPWERKRLDEARGEQLAASLPYMQSQTYLNQTLQQRYSSARKHAISRRGDRLLKCAVMRQCFNYW